MAERIVWNSRQLLTLLTDSGVADKVQETAGRVDRAVQNKGVETKTDFQPGPHRARSAVIAGYEHGATQENTRDALLSSLDGGAE